MKLLGSNNDTSYLYKNSNIDVCGDDIYEENIRKLLIENDIIIEKNQRTKNQKKKRVKKGNKKKLKSDRVNEIIKKKN